MWWREETARTKAEASGKNFDDLSEKLKELPRGWCSIVNAERNDEDFVITSVRKDFYLDGALVLSYTQGNQGFSDNGISPPPKVWSVTLCNPMRANNSGEDNITYVLEYKNSGRAEHYLRTKNNITKEKTWLFRSDELLGCCDQRDCFAPDDAKNGPKYTLPTRAEKIIQKKKERMLKIGTDCRKSPDDLIKWEQTIRNAALAVEEILGRVKNISAEAIGGPAYYFLTTERYETTEPDMCPEADQIESSHPQLAQYLRDNHGHSVILHSQTGEKSVRAIPPEEFRELKCLPSSSAIFTNPLLEGLAL